MKFWMEDITVYFPYYNIYPEQHAYMLDLKRTLDAGGYCLLEMPTGTGKTIALLSLSLILNYSLSRPSSPLKLLYCTRTIHEMEKTLSKLRRHCDYLSSELGSSSSSFLALVLTSRKNLCVNPRVLSAESRHSIDPGIGLLPRGTPPSQPASSLRTMSGAGSYVVLPPGVYTLQDLRAFGKKKGRCPYFLARHMVLLANVVVYSRSESAGRRLDRDLNTRIYTCECNKRWIKFKYYVDRYHQHSLTQ